MLKYILNYKKNTCQIIAVDSKHSLSRLKVIYIYKRLNMYTYIHFMNIKIWTVLQVNKLYSNNGRYSTSWTLCKTLMEEYHYLQDQPTTCDWVGGRANTIDDHQITSCPGGFHHKSHPHALIYIIWNSLLSIAGTKQQIGCHLLSLMLHPLSNHRRESWMPKIWNEEYRLLWKQALQKLNNLNTWKT